VCRRILNAIVGKSFNRSRSTAFRAQGFRRTSGSGKLKAVLDDTPTGPFGGEKAEEWRFEGNSIIEECTTAHYGPHNAPQNGIRFERLEQEDDIMKVGFNRARVWERECLAI